MGMSESGNECDKVMSEINEHLEAMRRVELDAHRDALIKIFMRWEPLESRIRRLERITLLLIVCLFAWLAAFFAGYMGV